MSSPPILRWLAISVFATSTLRAQEPAASDETLVEMKAIAGLRYDVPRFRVAPEAKVRIVLENVDDMAHNLVITAPGARIEIVTAAMTMPITPSQDFVPKSDKVLWAIPVLTPGMKGEVSFVAPKKEGVYPYLCSYPGHGLIMFGAMYVSKKASLPPLEKDANVPETAKELAGAAVHAFQPTAPFFYRMFMRDSGPASIAVALPGGQNYCWDAGLCRLRYAWTGGFIDPMPHWRGNGDAFAEIKGRIYWRADVDFPLRIGSRDKVPVVRFRGYRLIDRYPEFRYEIDGVEVRELIKPQHHGGIQDTFSIATAKAPVFYVAGPEIGAKWGSSVGEFKNGVLELTEEQARTFAITLTENPGVEPLGYWSMNDVLSDKRPLPVPGVFGRALIFDGKKSQFATHVKSESLKSGATFSLWAKLSKPEAKEQILIGAKAGEDQFALGYNAGGTGLGVVVASGGKVEQWHSEQVADNEWHHLAVIVSADSVSLYLDGQKSATLGAAVLPAGAEFYLGSQGGKGFAAATLDEARIYDRVLDEKEIQRLAARPVTTSPQ